MPVTRLSVLALLASLAGCTVSDSGFSPEPQAGNEQPPAMDAPVASVPPRDAAGQQSNDGSMPDASPAPTDVASPSGPPDTLVEPDLRPPADVRPTDATALANGQPCVADSNCASRFCVDSVCCESRCDGVCQACAREQTGEPNGLCRPNVANTPCGQPSCSGSQVTPAPRCEGQGACVRRQPQPCAGGLECDNSSSCKTRCDEDDDCAMGRCEQATGQCSTRRALGEACDSGAECASGFCVDGVCCQSSCQGLCRACVAAKTDAADGQCAPVSSGIDPDGECDRDPAQCRDSVCNGAGACLRLADGTVCATACCDGQGNGRGPCSFRCSQGICDREAPTIEERCAPPTCCCPNGGGEGVAACVAPGACGLSACLR